MATTNNTFDGMFGGKSTQEIERSLRAHRGALTKITCYIERAVNAATIMPTEKGCRELDQLKKKMGQENSGQHANLGRGYEPVN